jgi:hypothetical protein
MKPTPRYVPDSWHFGAILISLVLFAIEKAATSVAHFIFAFSDIGEDLRALDIVTMEKTLREAMHSAASGDLIYLMVCVSFLLWFHRVHRNLTPLGTASEAYTPRFAVVGFFIPLLNIVLPYHAMKYVNVASGPDFSPGLQADTERPPGAMRIAIWWILVIFGVLFKILSAAFVAPSASPTVNLVLHGIGDLINLAAILMTISVVVWIERKQAVRAERIGLLRPQEIHLSPAEGPHRTTIARMTDSCPVCDFETGPADLDEQTSTILCPQCKAVFDQRPATKPGLANDRNRLLGLPDRIEVVRGEGLRLRWYRRKMDFGGKDYFGKIVAIAFIPLYLYRFPPGSDALNTTLIVASLLVMAVLLWINLRRYLSRTDLVVAAGNISYTEGPIPPWTRFELTSDDIHVVYAKSNREDSKRERRRDWNVFARVGPDRRRVHLVRGLDTRDQAVALARAVSEEP